LWLRRLHSTGDVRQREHDELDDVVVVREHDGGCRRLSRAASDWPMTIRYKFVELSVVTDQSIETVVNTVVAEGWQLDAIRFAMSDASRRPQMAFISFVREVTEDGDDDQT
jgi:hypothetical protein